MFRFALSFAFGVFFIYKACFAEARILCDWAELMEDTHTAADQVGQFYLGGMTRTEPDAFYVAGSTAAIEKRSTKSGSLFWKASLEARSQGTWALTDELLLGADVKGMIYGIDRNTGEHVWKKEGKGIYFARPLVKDDKSYWVNSYGTLAAHRINDGSWLWQHSETATASLHLWSEIGPQSFAGLVISGFPSGLLMAFEPITGNRVWQESFGMAVEDSLSLNEVRSIQAEEGYLVASSYGGNIRMWKEAAGSKRLLWEKRMSLHSAARFDFEKSVVYVSERSGSVHAIDLESGYIKWSQYLKAGIGSTPAFGEKIVWVGSSGGFAQAFDRETGTPIGQAYHIDSPIFQTPLVVGEDAAIVLSSRGVLRRLQVWGTQTISAVEKLPATTP